MPVRYLNPSELYATPVFSHAVVVRQPATTIYVGGQNGVDKDGAIVGDLAAQSVRAVDNVRVALAEAGAELGDVISWTIALVDGQDPRVAFGAVQPVLADRPVPPIVAALTVAGLAVPGALIEVSAIAVLDQA